MIDSQGYEYEHERVLQRDLFQKIAEFLQHRGALKFLETLGCDLYAYPEEFTAKDILIEIYDSESICGQLRKKNENR
jgi:hypothetical protein